MLKKFFLKSRKRRDIRFMDAESYKYLQTKKLTEFEKNFDDDYIVDDYITVEKNQISSPFDELEEFEYYDSVSFLELIKQATSYNDPKVDLYDVAAKVKTLAGTRQSVSTPKHYINGLGIFSDSKIYSSLIQSTLSAYDLNIQHFNHPNTFKQENYDFFDGISSWIIFLSEDQDSDFLDCFLDRYVDKPTLFLFSKLNRDAFVKRITQFIQQNNLEGVIANTALEV